MRMKHRWRVSPVVVAGCVLSLALTVAAETVVVPPIGWRQTGGVAVPEGQTKTIGAPLLVGDRATFVKTGSGTLEVPAAALDCTAAHPTYAVLGGTLKITDAAVPGDANAVPACCQGAAVWFSAADTSFITGDANDVQRWYDVRETNLTAPTRFYMAHALGNARTESAASKQSLKVVDGRNAVYFGGLAAKSAGGYMHLQTPAGADAEFPIVRSIFFVHAVKECLGTVCGAVSDPSDLFTGPNIRPVGTIGYAYYRGDSVPGLITGRAYRNGDAFDIFHEKVAARAEVVAVDFTERAGKFATFFNQRGRNCADNRFGGDYLSEFIAFTNRLTEAEILAVNRYLMKKWNLGPNAKKPVRLELAKGTTVEFAPTVNMNYTNYYPVVFVGEGTVRQTGSQALSFPGEAFKEFCGTLELPSGKTVLTRSDELPSFVPEAGRTYTATLENRTQVGVNGALRVAATTEGPATTVTKKGVGDVTFAADRMPAQVKTLDIQAGTLTLRASETDSVYATASEGTGFNAVFANPNAELNQYANSAYSIESDRRLVFGRGTNPKTLDGWTKPDSSVGTSGYVVFTGGTSLGTWHNAIPEGNQAIFLMSASKGNKAEIYTTVTFPVAGDYLISWRETRNYGSEAFGSMGYALKLGREADGWAQAAVIAKRTAATGHFPRVYQKVTVPAPGAYVFGFQVDSYHYSGSDIQYQGLVVDDFRGDLLAQARSAAHVFKIPNGDFEETYTLDGIHGGKDISVLGEGTVATNWTFHQGANWPKADDANHCVAVGVAGYAFPRHYSEYYDGGNGYLSQRFVFGRNSDVKEGNHGLFLCQAKEVGLGSFAETTFIVPKAGTYLLRGKVSRWNISYLDKDFLGDFSLSSANIPYVGAQVTMGGVETDLGRLACDRHVQEDRVWPKAFTVAADNTSLTLRISETEQMHGAIVDDLVLVDVSAPSQDDGVEEFLRNGSFEMGVELKDNGDVTVSGDQGWTTIRGTKNDGSNGSMPNFYCNRGSTGQQYVKAAFDGEVSCNIRGTGEITQRVVLTPGRYRFRFAANSRNNSTYDKNGLVIALYNEAKTELKKTIFTTEAVTFYNPHVFETEFDLAEGGIYTFSVKGDPHDVEHAAGGERDNRSAVIDGLSLRKIAQDTARAVPQLAEDLRIMVATGAKLKLDFDGSVRINSVKFGSVFVTGEIDAGTFPEFIDGTGRLTVTPKGTIVIFR